MKAHETSEEAASVAESLTREVQMWVRCQLKQRGETQKELAARMHLSPPSVSYLLNAPDISLVSIARLALALGGQVAVGLHASSARAERGS